GPAAARRRSGGAARGPLRRPTPPGRLFPRPEGLADELLLRPAVLRRHLPRRPRLRRRPVRAALVAVATRLPSRARPGGPGAGRGAAMKFAAVIEYTPDKQTIAAARPTHRQYLTGLLQTGRLVAAGPFADDSGALIVYEADSAEEAEKLLRD